jgi:hypothetical protein
MRVIFEQQRMIISSPVGSPSTVPNLQVVKFSLQLLDSAVRCFEVLVETIALCDELYMLSAVELYACE